MDVVTVTLPSSLSLVVVAIAVAVAVAVEAISTVLSLVPGCSVLVNTCPGLVVVW